MAEKILVKNMTPEQQRERKRAIHLRYIEKMKQDPERYQQFKENRNKSSKKYWEAHPDMYHKICIEGRNKKPQ